jgi:hypothetical protein
VKQKNHRKETLVSLSRLHCDKAVEIFPKNWGNDKYTVSFQSIETKKANGKDGMENFSSVLNSDVGVGRHPRNEKAAPFSLHRQKFLRRHSP